MKNKGFTLIELLAVITVIAIIATITVITTNKIIKNTKNTLLKRQELTIEEAARDYYLKEGMNENINSKESCVNLSVLLSKGYLEKKEVKNPKTKEVMNGSVIITYSANQYSYNYQEDVCHYKNYDNGEVVYFDVTTGEKCSDYTETQSNTGVKSGCMKFYAFNDDGSDTLNLLLDHNTTALIAWNSNESNVSGPKEVLEQLKIDTDAWVGTKTPTNYSIDQSDQDSKAKYTVDYSEYKARLITAGEIAEITGNTTWDERLSVSQYFYFDTNTDTESTTCKSGDTSGCSYGWLYDRTRSNCTDYGCLNNSDVSDMGGYWTISPRASNSNHVWRVYYVGSLNFRGVGTDNSIGVRPVITISKSLLD